MKSFLKKIAKKHVLIISSLCLILFVAIAFALTHTTKHVESKTSKVKTTQTTSKSSKKKESSSSTSSTSSSTSSQSSSESTSEAQQAEAPATQTEQAPTQEYTQPAQPDDSCYPNGFQSDYFVSPDDGSNATPSQDWHVDQVQWGIEQGYIDE